MQIASFRGYKIVHNTYIHDLHRSMDSLSLFLGEAAKKFPYLLVGSLRTVKAEPLRKNMTTKLRGLSGRTPKRELFCGFPCQKRLPARGGLSGEDGVTSVFPAPDRT